MLLTITLFFSLGSLLHGHRLPEKLKSECGKRHFRQFQEVQFKIASSLAEVVS
jgi:hypothetical protein